VADVPVALAPTERRRRRLVASRGGQGEVSNHIQTLNEIQEFVNPLR
jgi:hypothetical protein